MQKFDPVEIFAAHLHGFVGNMAMSAFVGTEQDNIKRLQ
jgi:hypothetical protein